MDGEELAADLVVVGGGLAGLTAANRAAENGCGVILLEKGRDADYPCNSRIASGSFNLAHSDPTSGAATLRQAVMDDTEGYADPALAEAVSSVAGTALDWLRTEGVEFVKVVRSANKSSWSMAPPRPSTPGFTWKGRGPDLALRCLTKNLLVRGGIILHGTRARRLLMDGRRCSGVEAEQGGRPLRLRAASTVLADGGFQANPDLVRRFISPHPERLTQRNSGSGAGDALLMAEAVGALILGTDAFYGHLLVPESQSNDLLWPYPTLDSLASSAIVVDGTGRRFLDEGIGGVPMTNRLARLDDPLSAVTIFDSTIWETIGRADYTAPNPHLEQHGGKVVSAPDLRALAAALGLPPDALEATVRGYNAAVTSSDLASLIPGRTPGRLTGILRSADIRTAIRPIADPPFYGIRLCAGLTYTMGGIAIDAEARVLDAARTPIPGLYAAGSCTGGLEGGQMAGYVGGLCKALSLGFIAGQSVAAAAHAGASN